MLTRRGKEWKKFQSSDSCKTYLKEKPRQGTIHHGGREMRRKKTVSLAPAAPTPNIALVPLLPLDYVPRAHSQGQMLQRMGWKEKELRTWSLEAQVLVSALQSKASSPQAGPSQGFSIKSSGKPSGLLSHSASPCPVPVPQPLPHLYLVLLCPVLFVHISSQRQLEALIYLASELAPLKMAAHVPNAPRTTLCTLVDAKDLRHSPSLVLTTEWSRSMSQCKPSSIQNKHKKQTPGRAPTSSNLSWFSFLFCSCFFQIAPIKGLCGRHHAATTVRRVPASVGLPITWAALSPQLQNSDLTSRVPDTFSPDGFPASSAHSLEPPICTIPTCWPAYGPQQRTSLRLRIYSSISP